MPGFLCATCGQYHEGLPLTWGSPAPAAWYDIPEQERRQRTALSSDQCIIDNERFFLLGRLELPVVEQAEPFTWLTWVMTSSQDFARASDLWETPGRESEPDYAAEVQSHFPYEEPTVGLHAVLRTRPLGERPLVMLAPSPHPLVVEQQQGITPQRVQQLIELALHGKPC